MDTQLSIVLQGYYARERQTLATRPAVRAELLQLGVARITAEYDGVGDSGQIEEIRFLSNADPAQAIDIDEPIRDRVEALLYALLNLRHSGWENNDGAFGTFRWDLANQTLAHEHHQRYTDHETSLYEGFEPPDGSAS